MGQDDLHQQFLSLNEYFSHLGTLLANASDCLQEDGALPSQKLIEELVTARSDFDRFRGRVLAETQSLDLQPVPELEDIHSLRDLESLLHDIAHAEKAKREAEAIRQCALALLARVRMVEHTECESFAPLLDMQNNVAELFDAISNSRWADLPPDTHVLADGSHPFSTLLTLVERQAELDDEAWASLQDIVTQSFGRSMSVAAARGKLFFNEVAEDHVETVTADDEAISTVPLGDVVQGSALVSQDAQVMPSAAEAVGETLQAAFGGELQVGRDEITIETPPHVEGSEASTATMTEVPQIPERDLPYDTHSMEEEILDQCLEQLDAIPERDLPYDTHLMAEEVSDQRLKEQLDAIRKKGAGRQKQNFIKNIGRRFK